jgi:nitrous oxide reductase accessory protein NosL
MHFLKKPLLALLVLIFGALFAGCSSQNPQDSSIPWSRPANWEGQIPGMGTGQGQGGGR